MLSIILLIIFPFFVNFYGYFSKKSKKLYFAIYLFSFFKIVSGYIELCNEGVLIHYKNNKAVLIYFNKVFGLRNKFKPIQDYNLTSFSSVLDVGKENFSINLLTFSMIYNLINNNFGWYFHHNKPYLKINNEVNIFINNNLLNFYVKTNVVFNILTILINLVKMLLEKVLYGRKTKQN